MMHIKCSICKQNEESEYIHHLYWGRSGIFIEVCEECKNKLFSDPERSKREDSSICDEARKYIR